MNWRFMQTSYACWGSDMAALFPAVLESHAAAQHSTAQRSTAQHSTAQHSAAQRSTAQHSTAQHSAQQGMQHMYACTPAGNDQPP